MRPGSPLLALLLPACLASEGPPVPLSFDGPPPDFYREVRPLLAAACFDCHGPDAARQGTVRLDRPEALARAVTPGDPAASPLYERMVRFGPGHMPPVAARVQPTREEIATLGRWIARGATWEEPWFLRPPTRPPVPGDRHPIDAFLQQRLAAEGLQPAPEVAPAPLLRRLALDLTGLPPDPALRERWLADPSEDAYRALVRELLARPEAAEESARRWLDAARYADSHGMHMDMDREAWVWRDWVIDALERRLPFDRFSGAQLAGDLLSDDPVEHLATGFHRNHPISIEGGLIEEEYRSIYVADRTDTTATVWLGLSLRCARCHDHKYDPLSQRDYYRLFACFNDLDERGQGDLNDFGPTTRTMSPLAARARAALAASLGEDPPRLDPALAAELEARLRSSPAPRERPLIPGSARALSGRGIAVDPASGELTLAGELPDTEILELELPEPAAQAAALVLLVPGGAPLSEVELWTGAHPDRRPLAVALPASGSALGPALDAEPATALEHGGRVELPLEEPEAGAGPLVVRLRFEAGQRQVPARLSLRAIDGPLGRLSAEARTALALGPGERSPEQALALDTSLLLALAPPAERARARAYDELALRRAELERVPATMILRRGADRPTHLLVRGQYDAPGLEVSCGSPAALPPWPRDAPRDRRGLVEWLFSPEHPLTARVAVNRLWARFFGQGLVRTMEDLGSRGEPPTHPELLDWLAVELVESGWDLEHLTELMLTSRAYRQDSARTPRAAEVDPDNRLLARAASPRLPAELLRDQALAVSGLLLREPGGRSERWPQPFGMLLDLNGRDGLSVPYRQDLGRRRHRRSLYGYWKRTALHPFLSGLDAPDRETPLLERAGSNTAIQALALWDEPTMLLAARTLAEQVLRAHPAEEVPDELFRAVLVRRPGEEEQVLLRAAYAEALAWAEAEPEAAIRLLAVGDHPRARELDPARHAAATQLARVIFNLSEAVTRP